MKEKTPKTPRQLGAESKAIYDKHRETATTLELANDAVGTYIDRIHFFDSMVRAHEASPSKKRVSNIYGSTNRAGLEGNQKALEEAKDGQYGIGYRVLAQGRAQEAYDQHMKHTANHYEQNAAGYHALALAEAALDGVEIRISQPESLAEPIEVHRQ